MVIFSRADFADILLIALHFGFKQVEQEAQRYLEDKPPGRLPHIIHNIKMGFGAYCPVGVNITISAIHKAFEKLIGAYEIQLAKLSRK